MTNKQEEQTAANPESFKLAGCSVSPEMYLAIAAAEDVHFHFGQSSEDTALQRLFNKQTGGFYVDVGASHPYKYSNTYLLHRFFGWNGINIGASKDIINTFEAERPTDINLHTAVGMAGRAVYGEFTYPAEKMVSETNMQHQHEKSEAEIIGEEQVHVRTLAEIFLYHLSKGQTIDLLNVKVAEGHLEVLQSNNWEKYRPRAVLVEDYTVLTDDIEQSAIYRYMKQIGYTFSTHTFDTSLYLEKDFFAEHFGRNSQTKMETTSTSVNWLEDPVVYERALHLAKAHPEHKRLAELAVKSDKQLQLKQDRIKQLEQALQNARMKNEKSYQQELWFRARIDELQEEIKAESAAHKGLLIEFTELKQQLASLVENENQQQKQLAAENEELAASLTNRETTIQALRLELKNEQTRYEQALAQKKRQLEVQEHLQAERQQWEEEALQIAEELAEVHKVLKQEHAKNQKHLEEKYLLQQELFDVYQEMRSVFTVHQQQVDNKEEQLNEIVTALENQQKRNRKLEAKIMQKQMEQKSLDRTYAEQLEQQNKAKEQYKNMICSRSWRLTSPVRKMADIWRKKNTSTSNE